MSAPRLARVALVVCAAALGARLVVLQGEAAAVAPHVHAEADLAPSARSFRIRAAAGAVPEVARHRDAFAMLPGDVLEVEAPEGQALLRLALAPRTRPATLIFAGRAADGARLRLEVHEEVVLISERPAGEGAWRVETQATVAAEELAGGAPFRMALGRDGGRVTVAVDDRPRLVVGAPLDAAPGFRAEVARGGFDLLALAAGGSDAGGAAWQGRAPAPPEIPAEPPPRVAGWALALLLLGGTLAWAASARRVPGVAGLALLAAVAAAFAVTLRSPQAGPSAAALAAPGDAWTSRERLRLHPGNVFVPPGRFADVDVSATLRPLGRGVLEVRLGAPEADLAVGASLFAGAEPRLGVRFAEVGAARFERRGSTGASLLPGREAALRLELRGRHARAFVDGALVCEALLDRAPRGRLVLAAARGEVLLDGLRVTPRDGPAERGDSGSAARWRGLVAAGGVAGAGVAARPLLALPLGAAASGTALALLPAVAAFLPGAAPSVEVAVWRFAAVLLSGLLLLAPLVARRREASPWAGVVFVPLALLLVAGGAAVLAARAVPAVPRSVLDVAATQVSPPLADLTHPWFRRDDRYHEAHFLNGRSFAVPKPAGTRRVLLLGHAESSVLCAPPPADGDVARELEAGLDADVEVLNASFSAAHPVIVERVLDSRLLAFGPDVVVVVVPEAWVGEAGVLDVDAELARLGGPFARRTLPQRFAAEQRWRAGLAAPDLAAGVERVVQVLSRLDAAFAARGISWILVAAPRPPGEAGRRDAVVARVAAAPGFWGTALPPVELPPPAFLSATRLGTAGARAFAERLREAVATALAE